jgi:hypothetical protein
MGRKRERERERDGEKEREGEGESERGSCCQLDLWTSEPTTYYFIKLVLIKYFSCNLHFFALVR